MNLFFMDDAFAHSPGEKRFTLSQTQNFYFKDIGNTVIISAHTMTPFSAVNSVHLAVPAVSVRNHALPHTIGFFVYHC